MVLSGTSPSDFLVVQQHLFKLISGPSFHFCLPQLSEATWDTICNDQAERERLEFSGDSSMAAFVGSRLCSMLPKASPHQLTVSPRQRHRDTNSHLAQVARSALTANSTFARLMRHAGCGDFGRNVKSSGDAFETIVGAYEKQSGHAALQSWFEQNYMQLLTHAANVSRSLPKKSKGKDRPFFGLVAPQLVKPFRTCQRRQAVTRSPFTKFKRPIKTNAQYQAKLPTSLPAEMIDLTADDSDWEDEQHDDHTLVVDEDEIVEISMNEFRSSTRKPKSTNMLQFISIPSRSSSRASSTSDLTIASSATVSTNPEPGDANNPITID